MPRGVKRERNYDDEIERIAAQISQHEASIKALKGQLSSLKEEKEQNDLKSLNKLIRESGLSVKEVSKLLSDQKAE